MTHQPRPDVLPSETHEVQTGCEKIYVTISYLDDKPFEIFVMGAGAGCCQCSQNEAIGRLVSLALRAGITVDEISRQLSGIHCEKANVSGHSCPDVVSSVLRKPRKSAC